MWNAYEVLGVSEEAKEEEIRVAFRNLCFVLHPDRGGSHALCRTLIEAYSILSCPKRRKQEGHSRQFKYRGFETGNFSPRTHLMMQHLSLLNVK